MPLPDYSRIKDALLWSKNEEQSWGTLLRLLQEGSISSADSDASLHSESLKEVKLFKVLSEWDFFSSPSLDEAASAYGVKSWQITEFIEGLRDDLSIDQSDLIVYSAPPATPTPQAVSYQSPDSHRSTADLGQSEVEPSRAAHSPLLHPQQNQPSAPSKIVLALAAVVSALAVLVIALVATISTQRNGDALTDSGSGPSNPSDTQPSNPSPPPSKPDSTSDQVYFSGIDLPVTNRLCNKKKSFCIYNLASLVNRESGEATYTFSDSANGQQVNISGTITVSNIERNGSSRVFTFAFRDDQSSTTPGWAAAGYFNLAQDPSPNKPGILTKFKTTESFGPKTPVGLENTSYLFPD